MGPVVAEFDLDEVERRLDAGESMVTIAADVGVTVRTIRNRLNVSGRPLTRDRRRATRAQQARRLDDADWLLDQFVHRRLRLGEIATEAAVTIDEVRDALERHGVKRPPKHPELAATALRAAFASGATVKSIAREVGIERSEVRRAMRNAGVTNPNVAPSRPAVLDDRNWLIERYVTGSVSIISIAREVGVVDQTVRRALRRNSIPIRPISGGPPGGITEVWLRDQYVAQRLTQTELAAAAGVSTGTVARALDFYEIPRHPPRRGRARTGPHPPHPHTGRPGGINERWLKDQFVRRHRLGHDIAAECGVSTTTVWRAVEQWGLTRSAVRHGRKALSDLTWLRCRVVDEGATAADIARELGVAASTVRGVLRRHGMRRS